MQVPADAIIAVEKLTRYLLIHRPEDDKSAFLGQAGFTLANFRELEQAIRNLAAKEPALEDGANEFGTFYRVEGQLDGPNGSTLSVVLIWIQLDSDSSFRFVTLKPLKVKS
jgi:hypothetical protein